MPDYLKRECPSMWAAMQTIGAPARTVRVNDVQLKYVVTGVGGFTEKLHNIEGYAPHGVHSGRILDEMIVPRLKP